jgi:large subunit ribosomal protein L22
MLRVAARRCHCHVLLQSQLMVERAWTGKELTSPRIRYHSKGRAGRSHYRTSQLTVLLRQMTPDEQSKLVKFQGKRATSMLNPRGY